MKLLNSKKNKYCTYKVKTGELPLKDSKRDTIVQWMVDTHLVEWYVTYLLKQKVDEPDVQDKIQDIYLMIMEVPQEKWDNLYEQGKFSVSGYITGIVHQQIKSGNSAIWRTYTKYRQHNKIMNDEYWLDYFNKDDKE